jgi:uncharacterized protein (TIGR02246 family)
MSRHPRLLLALGGLLALWGGGAMFKFLHAQEARKPAPDDQAIRQAAAAYAEAFTKGNLDQLLVHWDPDAEYIDGSGQVTQGREAIAALVRKNLALLKGCKLAIDIKSVRLIAPDVALVDGEATLVKPDETVTTPYAAAWVKKDSHWRLRSLRDLSDTDQPALVTPADRLKGMEWIIGEWQSVDTTPEVHLNCHWAANRSFVLFDYQIKEGKQESTTTMRIGWDPVNDQFRSWYFDSAGGYGEGLWSQDGNSWVSDTTGVLPDGRIGIARYLVRFVNHETWEWQARNRVVDGRPLADVDVRLVRKSN